MSLSSRAPRETDTIAAIATPPGEGGIGIVRVSGAQAVSIAGQVCQLRSGRPLEDQPSFSVRMAKALRISSAGPRPIIDEVLVLVMKAPKTYTGEDIVEIQAHGGTVVLKAILDELLRAGARAAAAGEFTQRAFLSGRIDLVQAEAVLDLIHAKSEAARAFAQSQLGGVLSQKISRFREQLLDVLSHLEADIDFPDDFTDPQKSPEMAKRLQGLRHEIQKLIASAAVGFVAKRGLRAVIWGRPNVGKSSLLNALSRKNRVIVTPHPGTTRDVVEEEVDLDGFPLRLVDTAGVQETLDPIEREGVARSRLAVLAADLVLHVLDASQPLSADEEALLQASSARPRFLILNKSDLPQRLEVQGVERVSGGSPLIRVSCQSEGGVEALESALRKWMIAGRVISSEEPVVSSARQKDALEKMDADLERAIQSLENGLSPEFPSADIRRALQTLSELTGEITNEEVLDRLFSQFCIGK